MYPDSGESPLPEMLDFLEAQMRHGTPAQLRRAIRNL